MNPDFHYNFLISKKTRYAIVKKSIFLFTLFLSALLMQCGEPAIAAKKPTFSSLPGKLFVGDKAQIRIKNLSKTASVSFSSSKKGIAVITKKSGLLHAKKAGKTVIKANIYDRTGKKLIYLKKKITIFPKNHYLQNAVFSVKKPINPWNFSIVLSSSRILLKKEVTKSTLTLTYINQSAISLSAHFSSLSADGKKITYLLDKKSAKALCPGNGSMNGTYFIRSASFAKKLKISYEERLQKNTISGFVLHANGTPVENALIDCQTKNGKKSAYSDIHGFYQIHLTEAPTSLTVSKPGYLTEHIQTPIISQKGTICENFILKPMNDTAHSIHVTVTDHEKNPISSAKIFLINNKYIKNTGNLSYFLSKNASFYAETDEEGSAYLSKTDSEYLSCEEKIYLSTVEKNHSLTFSFTAESAFADRKIPALPESFSWNDTYTLYVTKEPAHGKPGFQPDSLTFSPAYFYTNHLDFKFCLKEQQELNTTGLKLQTETETPIESFSLSVYQPFQKTPVIQTSFSPPESSLPIYLADGTYYFLLRGTSENEAFSSDFVKITVKNSMIQPVTIPVKKIFYSRILLYYSAQSAGTMLSPGEILSGISLKLYRRIDDSLFYIDTISPESFSETSADLFTAPLVCSGLFSAKEYLLLPERADISISPDSITPAVSDLYPTKEEALAAPPLANCSCIFSAVPDSVLPAERNPETEIILPETDIRISQSLIRTADSYPNSVIAMYQKNGTFLSTSLLPGIKSQTNLSEDSGMITDIYTNRELLQTNQKSYHTE